MTVELTTNFYKTIQRHSTDFGRTQDRYFTSYIYALFGPCFFLSDLALQRWVVTVGLSLLGLLRLLGLWFGRFLTAAGVVGVFWYLG